MEKQLHYNRQYDNTTEPVTEIWKYTPISIYNALPNLIAVAVTAPDGGTTTEHYAAENDSPSSPPTQPEYVRGEVYKTELPDGSVIEKVYRSNVPVDPYHFRKANRFVKYEFVSIKDAAGNLTKTAVKAFDRDKNNNVTRVREYDYVAYTSIDRNSLGRVYTLPSGITPVRINKTEYYNDTPDSASGSYTDSESYHLESSPRLLNLVKSVELQNGSFIPQSRSELIYDHTNYTTNATGGNLVESRNWDSTRGSLPGSPDSEGFYLNAGSNGNAVKTTVQYDSYANPILTTDARGVQTKISYESVGGYPGLYPTMTETAYGTTVQRTLSTTYDFYTGAVTSQTDNDNNLTTQTEFDPLSRPIKVKMAVGTSLEVWTRTEYDDILNRIIVKSDVETKGDGKKIAVQHFDELGRLRLSRSIENAATEDPTNEADGIKVQTRYRYDNPTNPATSNGTYTLTSNPYRAATSGAAASEPSMGWTVGFQDKTGRYSQVETFGGAVLPEPFVSSGGNSNSTGVVKTEIDADRTLVTDQTGNRRISRTNALGQLVNVWEIKGADADTEAVFFGYPQLSLNGLKTSYQYDPLNNLTQVNQGVQTRTFSYSSLSRLLAANNPEAGIISYQYDANGNLAKKTDARSIDTVFTYDELNRVKTRSYSNETGYATPNVTYFYDAGVNAKGKLTKVTNGFSTTEYQSFDRLGRVTQSQQTTDGIVYNPMTYTFNLSGTLIEQKYPSGRVVENVLDDEGDLSIVRSKKNTNAGFWNYASSFTYTAARSVSSLQLGNGKWESTQFNTRLQPTRIALGTTQNTTNLLKLDYTYGTTQNNGNVRTQSITVPATGAAPQLTAVQTYFYDPLNRLTSATENINGNQTPSWKQTYMFDRYGNRRFDENNTDTLQTGCPTAVCNPVIDPATNKLIGYTFDLAGNTTKDAENRKFTYDAENKQVRAETVDSGGNPTGTIGEYFYDGDGKRVKKYVPATGETTIFLYDAIGKMVAEYSTLVEPTLTAQVSYLTADHLGSPRITTDKDGKVFSRRDFMPFGEEITTDHTPERNINNHYGEDMVRKKFTSYERDDEIDLDYAQARYYSSSYGRFTTIDPILIKQERLVDPQRLNLYPYVRNNPLKFVDVTGEDLILGNALAQQQARANIDKNLTAAERANVTIKGNKVVLVDPNAIDPTKASEGYKLFYEYINPNAQLNATYYGIQSGQTVTTASGRSFTYQDVVELADITVHVSKTDIELIVPVGANVVTADSSNPSQPIAFPEHLIFAHGLAHGSCGDSGMCAVNRENLLRQEQGLPLRSTTVGHRNFDANGKNITIPFYSPQTVNVQSTAPSQIITSAPAILQRTIDLMPIEPLPKKPN